MKKLFPGISILAMAVALIVGIGSFAFRPAVAQSVRPFLQRLATITCSSGTACETYANTSTGPGAKSTSSKGNGLDAATMFASTQVSNGKAGLLGQDLSASGQYDSGVTGTAKRGIGVLGTTAAVNLAPFTYPLAGVVGISTATKQGVGVYGSSASGPAVFGSSTAPSAPGVLGMATTNTGVDAQNAGLKEPALLARNSAGGPVLWLDNPAGNSNVMNVDSDGNMHVSGDTAIDGSLTLGGGCTGCNNNHRLVEAYPARVTAPTLEDFGEARLVNGFVRVRLDSAYANAIAPHRSYLVFITPEGDNRGLFVANKMADGFDVHEAQGGRSSIAFSYRVVARPFGAGSARLPTVNRLAGHAS